MRQYPVQNKLFIYYTVKVVKEKDGSAVHDVYKYIRPTLHESHPNSTYLNKWT